MSSFDGIPIWRLYRIWPPSNIQGSNSHVEASDILPTGRTSMQGKSDQMGWLVTGCGNAEKGWLILPGWDAGWGRGWEENGRKRMGRAFWRKMASEQVCEWRMCGMLIGEEEEFSGLQGQPSHKCGGIKYPDAFSSSRRIVRKLVILSDFSSLLYLLLSKLHTTENYSWLLVYILLKEVQIIQLAENWKVFLKMMPARTRGNRNLSGNMLLFSR